MTNTTTKTPRITKSMKFDAIRAALNGEVIPHDLTIADLMAFIDAEQALLVRKNTAEKRPTAKQVENEGFRSMIVDFLALQSEGMTCTDIQKGIPAFAEFNNQKVAALVRPLVKDGTLVKNVVKGRALFSLA